MTQELTNYVRRSVLSGRVVPVVTAAAREWSRRRTLAPRVLDADVTPNAAVMPAPVNPAPGSGEAVEWPASWTLDAVDPERAWQSHRFGWALRAAAASSAPATARRLSDEVRGWSSRPEARDERVWDSYSVSERLANWSLLASVLAARGDTSLTADAPFRAVVDEHAKHLSQRLEDYGDGYTNNHSLNNARALYWYGAMWGAPAAGRAAGRLAADCAGRLFTPSGFLAESSSHYHVMLARTLIEVLLLARATGDRETAEAIAPVAARAADRAAFLMAGNRLPLIGDVSPDAPPSWTAGLITLGDDIGAPAPQTVAAPPGWHSLWTARGGIAPALPAAQAVSFPDAGWYRVTHAGWDVIAHVNPDGAVGPRSHGHLDLGGVELAWQGRPVIVDPGLPVRGAAAWDARVGSSHSIVRIDGYEPMLAWGLNGYPSAMDRSYWDTHAGATVTETSLRITHRGFARIFPGCGHARSIELAAGRAAISDRVTHAAGRTIDLFVQLSPSIEVTGDHASGYTLAGPGYSLRAAWTVDGGEITGGGVDRGGDQGWYSPEYGVQVPAPRLRLRLRGAETSHITLRLTDRAG